VSQLKKVFITAVLAITEIFFSALAVADKQSADPSSVESSLSVEDKELAKRHFLKGQHRFEQKEFQEAADHFEKAYEITGASDLLYNIGRCYEELENEPVAIEKYKMYLRLNPDAKDKDEVNGRIVALLQKEGDSKKSRRSEEDDDYERDDIPAASGNISLSDDNEKKRLEAFSLEFAMGPSWVIVTPQINSENSARHPYFEFDILGHFWLSKWFAISAVVLFAGYIEGDTAFIGRDATGHMGLGVGVTFMKRLKSKVSLGCKIMAIPTAINRKSTTDRAVWFNFQAAFDFLFHLPANWALVGEILGGAGPVVIVKKDAGDPWTSHLYADAGFRIGAVYTF
jgi:tetratricopeptide (TPR) repeat protein